MCSQKEYRYLTINLEEIKGEQHYTREETKERLKIHVNIKGKLNPQFRKLYYIEKYNLYPLIKSIVFYTEKIENKNNFVERIYWILNDIYENPKCQVCQNNIVKFANSLNDGYNKYCSHTCNGKINYPTSHFTLEELAQYKIRMQTCRPGYKPSIEARIKMSESANKYEVIQKKQKTCLERYGISNPGILGAWHSRAADRYIKEYINKNQINEKCCYFHGGGISNREFFQMITIPAQNKKRYVSYDLVVFKDYQSAINKELNKIDIVLEYNGAWHYTREEIKGHETELSVPYKNTINRTTKEESVVFDEAKLNHVKKYANNVYVYWEKTKVLERVK